MSKLMVTSFASIWYQSLGWWWCWFNVSLNLFLTRMSHHLEEPFDSMNYHWFRQQNVSNWVEQDVSYNRWCHQHRHLVVSWLSCLNYLLVEQAVVCSVAAIHKSEHDSMDFNPNVKFQVGWDNTQYIPKLYHHKDQNIPDPRNALHLFLNRNLCGLYKFLPLCNLSRSIQVMKPWIIVARILRGPFTSRDENCSIFIY